MKRGLSTVSLKSDVSKDDINYIMDEERINKIKQRYSISKKASYQRRLERLKKNKKNRGRVRDSLLVFQQNENLFQEEEDVTKLIQIKLKELHEIHQQLQNETDPTSYAELELRKQHLMIKFHDLQNRQSELEQLIKENIETAIFTLKSPKEQDLEEQDYRIFISSLPTRKWFVRDYIALQYSPGRKFLAKNKHIFEIDLFEKRVGVYKMSKKTGGKVLVQTWEKDDILRVDTHFRRPLRIRLYLKQVKTPQSLIFEDKFERDNFYQSLQVLLHRSMWCPHLISLLEEKVGLKKIQYFKPYNIHLFGNINTFDRPPSPLHRKERKKNEEQNGDEEERNEEESEDESEEEEEIEDDELGDDDDEEEKTKNGENVRVKIQMNESERIKIFSFIWNLRYQVPSEDDLSRFQDFLMNQLKPSSKERASKEERENSSHFGSGTFSPLIGSITSSLPSSSFSFSTFKPPQRLPFVFVFGIHCIPKHFNMEEFLEKGLRNSLSEEEVEMSLICKEELTNGGGSSSTSDIALFAFGERSILKNVSNISSSKAKIHMKFGQPVKEVQIPQTKGRKEEERETVKWISSGMKGGVGVSFRIRETSLCFVNVKLFEEDTRYPAPNRYRFLSHLNEKLLELLDKLSKSLGEGTGIDLFSMFDRVFVLGGFFYNHRCLLRLRESSESSLIQPVERGKKYRRMNLKFSGRRGKKKKNDNDNDNDDNDDDDELSEEEKSEEEIEVNEEESLNSLENEKEEEEEMKIKKEIEEEKEQRRKKEEEEIEEIDTFNHERENEDRGFLYDLEESRIFFSPSIRHGFHSYPNRILFHSHEMGSIVPQFYKPFKPSKNQVFETDVHVACGFDVNIRFPYNSMFSKRERRCRFVFQFLQLNDFEMKDGYLEFKSSFLSCYKTINQKKIKKGYWDQKDLPALIPSIAQKEFLMRQSIKVLLRTSKGKCLGIAQLPLKEVVENSEKNDKEEREVNFEVGIFRMGSTSLTSTMRGIITQEFL